MHGRVMNDVNHSSSSLLEDNKLSKSCAFPFSFCSYVLLFRFTLVSLDRTRHDMKNKASIRTQLFFVRRTEEEFVNSDFDLTLIPCHAIPCTNRNARQERMMLDWIGLGDMKWYEMRCCGCGLVLVFGLQ